MTMNQRIGFLAFLRFYLYLVSALALLDNATVRGFSFLLGEGALPKMMYPIVELDWLPESSNR